MNRLTYKVNDAYYVKESRHLYEDCNELVAKLGQYEDLEEELGISLPILFKALKNGVWFLTDDWDDKRDFDMRPQLLYSDGLRCYCFELRFGIYYVNTKDYGKTWWLKEDLKSE